MYIIVLKMACQNPFVPDFDKSVTSRINMIEHDLKDTQTLKREEEILLFNSEDKINATIMKEIIIKILCRVGVNRAYFVLAIVMTSDFYIFLNCNFLKRKADS